MQKVSTNTTILVVEDNPDHVGLIEAIISRGLRGAQVRVALLCEGARRYLRGPWSAYDDDAQNNPLPDLIVLDLWLPDGSGFDVLRWIARRERLKDIPVIVFSASTDPEHARLAEMEQMTEAALAFAREDAASEATRLRSSKVLDLGFITSPHPRAAAAARRHRRRA